MPKTLTTPLTETNTRTQRRVDSIHIQTRTDPENGYTPFIIMSGREGNGDQAGNFVAVPGKEWTVKLIGAAFTEMASAVPTGATFYDAIKNVIYARPEVDNV